MATSTTKPTNLSVKPDDYLTDGIGLARVYAVETEHVILEDAVTYETFRLTQEDAAERWRRLSFERYVPELELPAPPVAAGAG